MYVNLLPKSISDFVEFQYGDDLRQILEGTDLNTKILQNLMMKKFDYEILAQNVPNFN